mmetsp:Transcript_10690/g.24937  ORF Transcript_10690/g.24937 Transcript_10690/m.24937 type:complete len:472 (+) Transcript_10690:35-1450(+)
MATILDRIDLAGTRCNDGSLGAMYFSPAPLHAGMTVLHVHLEGGGYCYDQESCESPQHGDFMRSTRNRSGQIQKGGIFARGPGAMPALAAAAHAYIAYCSSDSWTGNSTVLWSGRPWHFEGAQILATAVSTLLDQPRLRQSALVLFSGCSAGGRGMLYNLDGLCDLVRAKVPSAKCAGLGDAAFWVDSVLTSEQDVQKVWESALRRVALLGSQLWGGSSLSKSLNACRRNSFHPGPEFTAGASLGIGSPNISTFDACLFGPALSPHVESPLLLAMQLNDHFQFDHLARGMHTIYIGGELGGPVSLPDMAVMGALRAKLTQTLDQSVDEARRTKENLRMVFAPACFGHCVTEENSYYTIRLKNGAGEGLSLNDTVGMFVGGVLGWYQVSSQAFIEEDQCRTLSCSTGCVPRKLWKAAAKAGVEYVALPFLALCVCIRLACGRAKPKGQKGDTVTVYNEETPMSRPSYGSRRR